MRAEPSPSRPASLLVRVRVAPGTTRLVASEPATNGATNGVSLQRDDGDHASESSGASVKRSVVEDMVVEDAKRKKRRPSYAVRKEELIKLSSLADELEARVQQLRARVGMPSLEEHGALTAARETRHELEEAWRTQALAICGLHAMVGKQMRDQFWSPLHSYMRLGKDLKDRHATLQSMREMKLTLGRRYMEERLRDVDNREPYDESALWTSSRGDFCGVRADIMLLEGVQSVKHAFDALLFFLTNMEISISEVLGQLTLREEIDLVDTRISNHRIISSTDHGVVVELNAVSFSEFYESNGEEFAFLVNDWVDEDDLYPYCPHERARKNLSGAISFSSFRRPSGDAIHGQDDELVVVMKRCVFLSMPRPQFAMSKAAKEDLRQNLAIWGDVMTKTMREYLHIGA